MKTLEVWRYEVVLSVDPNVCTKEKVAAWIAEALATAEIEVDEVKEVGA